MSPERPGCLSAAPRLVALAVLGPAVALVRRVQRRRRGTRVRWRLERRRAPSPSGAPVWLDLEIDLPAQREAQARGVLVAALARVAEALRSPGDVYHLVQRPPWEEEAELRPVGPQVQELAEHLALRWSRPALDGTTGVWLVLPRGRWLAEVVGSGYDPEAAGEPERLLLASRCRWGFAEAVARTPGAVRFRVVVYAGADRAQAVARHLGAAARRLAGGGGV